MLPNTSCRPTTAQLQSQCCYPTVVPVQIESKPTGTIVPTAFPNQFHCHCPTHCGSNSITLPLPQTDLIVAAQLQFISNHAVQPTSNSTIAAKSDPLHAALQLHCMLHCSSNPTPPLLPTSNHSVYAGLRLKNPITPRAVQIQSHGCHPTHSSNPMTLLLPDCSSHCCCSAPKFQSNHTAAAQLQLQSKHTATAAPIQAQSCPTTAPIQAQCWSHCSSKPSTPLLPSKSPNQPHCRSPNAAPIQAH